MSDQEAAAPAKRKKSAPSQQLPWMVQTTLHRFCKGPEQVVDERRAPGFVRPELSRKDKEKEQRLHRLIAGFFYECSIPPSVVSLRSFDVALEATMQYGPGYVPPSPDELRGPLFDEQMKEMEKLREKHDKAWKLYGCTLMIDSWTDRRRNLHWINFLVKSVQGMFFLESVDASDQSRDVVMLADLIEKRIEAIGREKVVQVITGDNNNLKAACKLLMERIPSLFWTPCAFQCLDVMLDDIAKLKEFRKHIEHAKRVTTFIYRHSRLLFVAMEKIGGKDPVILAATRSSTTFLTLESLYKHKDALRCLFVNEDWSRSKLSGTEAGKRVCDIVLSTRFWNVVEDCIKASEPLLAVLKMVHDDERPAMPEVSAGIDLAKKKINESFACKPGKVSAGIDLAKKKINESFACKPGILKKVMDIVENRWADQMEQKLYGAALFLNPNNFFDIKENDYAYASRLRAMFNDVIAKVVTYDADLVAKIGDLTDQYESMGNSFGKVLLTNQRKAKSPNDWWRAYGGYAGELQKVALRIISLGCSSFGSERDWSVVVPIHTIKPDQLDPVTGFEHKRLKDYAYLRYNLRIESRSRRQHVEGSNFNALIEDFNIENEWANMDAEVHTRDDLAWANVDEVTGASHTLDGHSVPWRAHDEATGYSQCGSSKSKFTDEPDSNSEEDETFVADDYDVEDDYGLQDPLTPSDESGQPGGNEAHMDNSEWNDDF